AREDIPAVAAMPNPTLDEVRRTRNRIVHFGFSPADDSITAGLLLGGALPLLEAVYAGYFSFDLLPSLAPEFERQLRATLGFFDQTKADPAFPFEVCFVALGHSIRRGAGEAARSWAEALAADRGSTVGLEFEAVSEARGKLER